MTIQNNLKIIQKEIQGACSKVHRNPADVQIVAVSKTFGIDKITEAIKAGITVIGENKVQEAWNKFQNIGPRVTWHFIGHLQTNKVKRVLQFADVIESVDSLHLAKEINKKAEELHRTIEVFIQVNTLQENTKFGVKPRELANFIDQLNALDHLKVSGLMTIASYSKDISQVRPCFTLLREIRDQINDQKIAKTNLRHLSMGMTNDFQVAVEEGATLVRIGQALFGERR